MAEFALAGLSQGLHPPLPRPADHWPGSHRACRCEWLTMWCPFIAQEEREAAPRRQRSPTRSRRRRHHRRRRRCCHGRCSCCFDRRPGRMWMRRTVATALAAAPTMWRRLRRSRHPHPPSPSPLRPLRRSSSRESARAARRHGAFYRRGASRARLQRARHPQSRRACFGTVRP